MEIGVVIIFAILVFSFRIEVNCHIDGIKSDGILRQNEKTDRGSVIESFGSPTSYEDGSVYANINPFLYNNIMKRSPIDRNTGRRQTGIIYGDGKPIGILQPYEESFKFMPIKEEKVYALDGGRSDLNEQEPYLNLMYPLARFARSEDALKMAEYESERAEFLEKHYPSMLVDFKIRDKLHANRAKSMHQDVKREKLNYSDGKDLEQKRQLQLEDRKAEKGESDPSLRQMAQKREAEKPLKLQAENDQPADTYKREAKNLRSDYKNAYKRGIDVSQTVEFTSSPKFEKREGAPSGLALVNRVKNKRENILTDAQFDQLKNTVSKRSSKENVDLIENDLRGLLSDMGLIEDDLEEDAEEMEKVRSAVNEEIDSDESIGGNPVLPKEKIEPSIEQGEYRMLERMKRTQAIANAKYRTKNSFESSGSNAEAENHVDNIRSSPAAIKDKRRVIDVNFITKNREDKMLTALNCESKGNCSRAADIPNKREASEWKRSISELKIPEATISTTETYAQYEERVAREIKNKIQQLKEEVKRELGALEEDNDEEDEDEESVGEPQRKKRFVANTLMDEEANNIDPNSNAEDAELQPHVRRRRMLSIDMLNVARDEEEPVISEKRASIASDSLQSGTMFDKGKFEVGPRNTRPEKNNLKADNLSTQEKSLEEEALKYMAPKKNGRFNFDDESYRVGHRNFWNRPQKYSKGSIDFYYPKFHKRSFVNYIPWNAVQTQSRNLNTGVYSYESESEGNSESKTQPESKFNPEIEPSKKTQQYMYNPQALPKDPTAERPGGYNQNYYVYYLGKNQQKSVENPQNSQVYARPNRPTNYQEVRMVYPQFQDNVNLLQKNEQYMTASNDDQNQNSMSFRIMYKMPAGRRRKRQVARNFFLPFKDTEDAIVTNTFSDNIRPYELSIEKGKNYTRLDSLRYNPTDGDTSRRLNTKEKGEECFSKDDEPESEASDTKLDFTKAKSKCASDNYKKTNSEIIPEKSKKNNEKRFLKTNSSPKISQSNNSSIYRYTPKNNLKNSVESINCKSPEDRVNSRKILSSTINNEQVIQSQNIETTTFSLDNYSFKSDKSESVNSDDNSLGYMRRRINDMDYKDGEYLSVTEEAVVQFSTNANRLEDSRSRPIALSKTSEEIKHFEKAEFGTTRKFDSFSSLPPGRAELIGDKIGKNDLYVSEYLPSEWKRRKRDAGFDTEDRNNVRKRRLNWFWPVKSSFGGNTLQIDEYEQFEPNEVSDSDKDSSERFKDISTGVDSNYDDLGVDVGDYDRKKRQLKVEPVYDGRNQITYSRILDRYLPESRARRYSNGWYREPHRELLTDMSDVELFGALPQSYAGELNRYKRVKRGRRGTY